MNTVQEFFGSIYRWMAIGVLLSAGMAWLTMNSPLIVLLQTPTIYVVMAVTVGLALGAQFFINKLSAGTAFLMYLAYAALNGVTMAGFLAYFLATDPKLVVVIFIAAATMFGFLAVLGYTTKRDMSGWGTFLIAGAWGVFVVSLLNIWLQSDTFSYIISAVALVVFAGLTVYDNQYYKNVFAQLQSDDEKSKMATIGALHMYINFIMIFQSLLNLSRLGQD